MPRSPIGSAVVVGLRRAPRPAGRPRRGRSASPAAAAASDSTTCTCRPRTRTATNTSSTRLTKPSAPASPGSRRSWTISSSRSLARSLLRSDVELAVLAVGRDHEVDLVGQRVLGLVVVVVIVIVVVVGVVVGLRGRARGVLVPSTSRSSSSPGGCRRHHRVRTTRYSSSLYCDMPLLQHHDPDEPCPSCQTAPRTTTRIPAPDDGSIPFARGPVHRGPPARRAQADGPAGRARPTRRPSVG